MKTVTGLQAGWTALSLILGVAFMEGCTSHSPTLGTSAPIASGGTSGGGGTTPPPAIQAPTVTASVPAGSASNVPVTTQTLTAAFSEAMDPTSLTATSFTLACPAGSAPLAGTTVSYDPATRLATLTLGSNTTLAALTLCQAQLTTAVKDLAGSPLAATLTWGFTTGANLGSMTVLAGSMVMNTGPTVISGNLGVSPGAAVPGFPPGVVANGTIHSADATAAQAQTDLEAAWNYYQQQQPTAALAATGLDGATLGPGVYAVAAPANLAGQLKLDASGDPAAIFIFQIGSNFTTASASSVQLLNGAQSGNVFWQVGTTATLGAGCTFKGILMAEAGITMVTGAALEGRALSRNGWIVLDTITIGPAAP